MPNLHDVTMHDYTNYFSLGIHNRNLTSESPDVFMFCHLSTADGRQKTACLTRRVIQRNQIIHSNFFCLVSDKLFVLVTGEGICVCVYEKFVARTGRKRDVGPPRPRGTRH